MSQETENDNAIIVQMEKLVKEYKAIPYQPPKPLTVPKIFNKSYDENFISDFLAYILDPFKNGIGFSPLNSLITCSKNNEVKLLDASLSREDISIRREHPFEDRKRIDLRVKIKDEAIICVENKIFSGEGKNQTIQYAASIKKEFPDYAYLFLYLTPRKTIAPSSDEFIHISYPELIEILEPLEKKYFRTERHSMLFKEFVLHIKEYIMNAKTLYLSEKSKLYLNYKGVIDDLTQSFKNNSADHFECCKEIIRSIFLSDCDEWEFDFVPDRAHQKVFKKSWPKNKDLDIHFEYSIPEKSLLINQKIGFMLDVEGPRKIEFRREFQKIFGKIEINYQKSNMKYLPNSRSIAYKEYNFSISAAKPDGKAITDFFQKGYDEFKFIIPVIDDIASKFKLKEN